MLVSCPPCDFLLLRIASSHALCKSSLKICQLFSTPLSLRAVCQGISQTRFPKDWKSAFLKFKSWTFTPCPSPILQGCTLQQRVIPAAQAASSPGVQLAHLHWWPTDPVPHSLWQGCLSPGSGSYPPRIPGVSSIASALQATFPTAAGVAEFPCRPRPSGTMPPVLEQEGLVHGLPLVRWL